MNSNFGLYRHGRVIQRGQSHIITHCFLNDVSNWKISLLQDVSFQPLKYCQEYLEGFEIGGRPGRCYRLSCESNRKVETDEVSGSEELYYQCKNTLGTLCYVHHLQQFYTYRPEVS